MRLIGVAIVTSTKLSLYCKNSSPSTRTFIGSRISSLFTSVRYLHLVPKDPENFHPEESYFYSFSF